MLFFSPLQYFSPSHPNSFGAKTRIFALLERGVHNAGVNKLVEDDDVIFAQQGADGSGAVAYR